MRIGLIAPPWLPVPPIRYGGTEGVLDTLARGLLERGHAVTLFTVGSATCPVPRRWAYREPPPHMGTTVEELHHVSQAYDALSGVDLIHDHTVAGPAWLASRSSRAAVIATNHAPFNRELRSVFREYARRVTISAISHAQRAQAPEIPMAAVVHHGIDASKISVGEGTGGYAVFVGRFAMEKGVHRAIAIARRAGVPLRIIAKMREPAEVAYFNRWVKPTLCEDIQYLGELTPEERNAQIGGSVALINPINWPEPFGLVMIEAMAIGTPVIAWAEGSVPEVIDHGCPASS